MKRRVLSFYLYMSFILIALNRRTPFAEAEVDSLTSDKVTTACTCVDTEERNLTTILSQKSCLGNSEQNLDQTNQLTEIKMLIRDFQVEMKSALLTTYQSVRNLYEEVYSSKLMTDSIHMDIMNQFERLEIKEAHFTDDTNNENETNGCKSKDYSFKTLHNSDHNILDCSDINRLHGKTESGTYRIYTSNSTSYIAYCDMNTDGGGWTVFQRRIDGSEDFNRGWIDYKYGFGNVTREHWLGNKALSELSSNCRHCELRIDIEDFSGNRRYATFSEFGVSSEAEGFKLKVGKYSGNAGNSLSAGHTHNGMWFSTRDVDLDNSSEGSCAKWLGAGWWFNDCLNSNLNGLYIHSQTYTPWSGIIWYAYSGHRYSLKASKMMMRQSRK